MNIKGKNENEEIKNNQLKKKKLNFSLPIKNDDINYKLKSYSGLINKNIENILPNDNKKIFINNQNTYYRI